jgi:nucleotide-binding universal stress UspA family protein
MSLVTPHRPNESRSSRAPAPEAGRTPRTRIVGYDGSDEARAAFAVALDRSEPSDLVVAIHATAPSSSWLGQPNYGRSVVESQSEAERILDELRPMAEQSDVRVEFDVLEGPPAEALIRVATVREADEIVVGSRGRNRLHATLGSVSHDLLREAARPVLVIGPDAATVVLAAAVSPIPSTKAHQEGSPMLRHTRPSLEELRDTMREHDATLACSICRREDFTIAYAAPLDAGPHQYYGNMRLERTQITCLNCGHVMSFDLEAHHAPWTSS